MARVEIVNYDLDFINNNSNNNISSRNTYLCKFVVGLDHLIADLVKSL